MKSKSIKYIWVFLLDDAKKALLYQQGFHEFLNQKYFIRRRQL